MEKYAELGFSSWLATFSAASISRLRAINESTSSSRHIILALAYGLTDPRIAKINVLITRLLIMRLRAERRGESKRIERIEGVLSALHLAIDRATNFDASTIHGGGQVCRARGGLAKTAFKNL